MTIGDFTARVQQAFCASPYFTQTCQREIVVLVECLANTTAPLYTVVTIKEKGDQAEHILEFREHVYDTPLLHVLWALQLVYADYLPNEEVLKYVEKESQQGFVALTRQRRKSDAGEGLERSLPDPLAGDTRSPLPEQTQRFLRTYSRHRRRIG